MPGDLTEGKKAKEDARYDQSAMVDIYRLYGILHTPAIKAILLTPLSLSDIGNGKTPFIKRDTARYSKSAIGTRRTKGRQ